MSLSPSSSSEGNNKEIFCQWSNCYRTFDDVESLYNHLSADHVGRKSMGNLCLDCHWEDCDVKTTKRDHITSHLRVHVPLKPHVCQTCKKAFKRPQDLKKHYKIHTEEHQQHLNFMKCQRLSKKLCSPPSPPYCYPPHRQRKLNNPSSSILLSNPQQLGNDNNNNSKSNGDNDSNSNSNNDRNIVVPNHSINNNARLPSISSSFYFTPNNHNVPNIPSQHINNNNNNNSNNKNNNISSSNDNNIFNNNQNFIAWQL